MKWETIIPDKSIALLVKQVMVFEDDQNQQTILPFFADGYPGLMFQQTENGLLVNPHRKQMPVIFLYGQTLHPIELVMQGKYRLIVFQLYPFVLKSLFHITPGDINDDCYNLEPVAGKKTLHTLNAAINTSNRINIITRFLHNIFQSRKSETDAAVKQAIQLIIQDRGQVTVKHICSKLNLTERTFERRFINETGLSPKQFSRIIQFAQSLEQLAVQDFTKLTDVVYTNGYADQSHFIRVFKAFTGKTPKKFKPTLK
jgi:AraC-like DNA-binding protein